MEARDNMTDRSGRASPQELRYARILQLGARAGLVLLILCFALYVLGIVAPLVPLSDLPKYWGMSAPAFAAATNHPTGWGWLRQIGKADVAILAPIAFLAAVSALCGLAVLPQFIRRGEFAHAAILVLQVLVLVLAASNVVAVGH
jgi:hypothetical protein